MTSNLPSPTIIASPSALRELVRRLQNEPLIAIDTESNSLYAYREKVCLVQISTRDHDWLVDPLAVRDLSPLGPLFADPDIENVFHASEYDIMCMKRDYDFKFNNLFDTMFAARILGLKSFGLGSLLEAYFDVQVDKRYQRADWSQRPIPAELLQYAQMDTHYLPALRDILRDQLMDQDRLIEAKEVFDLLTEVPASAHTTDPEGFWRIHLARDFSRKQFAILRELYILRETLAEQRDRPPFKVFTDQVLVAITLAEPHTLKELGAVNPQRDQTW
jgi:ribonuclease D